MKPRVMRAWVDPGLQERTQIARSAAGVKAGEFLGAALYHFMKLAPAEQRRAVAEYILAHPDLSQPDRRAVGRAHPGQPGILPRDGGRTE